jgi:hypothetical protein
MAEPAPAKSEAPAPIRFNITGSAPAPLTQSQAINGTVYFTCLDRPYNISTWDPAGTPANVFVGETNDYLVCVLGINGPYSFNTSVVNVGDTVTFEPNPPSSPQRTEAGAKGDVVGVKGTITITNVRMS